MIFLENVSLIFNAHTNSEKCALKNINLKISRGEFITIVGSNGAGKSTLYNVISGTYAPTTGKIFFERGGKMCDVTGEKEHKRAFFVGRIFQDPLMGNAGKMSLEDNLAIAEKKGLRGLKISLNAKKRSYFRDLLFPLSMNLENRLLDNVELFSGGQRQALALLMAAISKPDLLLLDEHTAALDPENAKIIMEQTCQIAKEKNLTVMMITHNMKQALEYGNRILMMDSGKIIFDAKEDEKRSLTIETLIQKFRELKKSQTESDEMLLQ